MEQIPLVVARVSINGRTISVAYTQSQQQKITIAGSNPYIYIYIYICRKMDWKKMWDTLTHKFSKKKNIVEISPSLLPPKRAKRFASPNASRHYVIKFRVEETL